MTDLDNAIKEAKAQLAIMRVLKKVDDPDKAKRILQAVCYLCEADRLVPGILDHFTSPLVKEHVK